MPPASAIWQGRLSTFNAGGGTGEDFAWTDIPALTGTDKDVYVSSSTGNNAWDGLSESFTGANHGPKRDIADGVALLTNNTGDRLRLKKGDTWTNQNFGTWTKSGVSSARRMIIYTYGTGARPIVQTGSSSFIQTDNVQTGPAHILFVGIECTSQTYAGGAGSASGANIISSCQDWTFEDCYIHNYFNGLVLQAFWSGGTVRHTDFRVRACAIADIWKALPDTGNTLAPQGMYIEGIDNITVESCIIHNAGWTDDAQWSQFRHSCYMQNGNTGCIFKDNILANTDGAQVRPGGIITGNVFSRLHNSFSAGIGNTPALGGCTVLIEDNVILEGRDVGTALGGSGARLGDITSGTFKRNIFASGTGGNARIFWFNHQASVTRIAENLVVEDCIGHNWGGHTAWFEGAASEYNGNTMNNCVFQNPDNANETPFEAGNVLNFSSALVNADWNITNSHFVKHTGLVTNNVVYYGGPTITLAAFFTAIGATACDTLFTAYADPDRTLDTYAISIGLTGHEQFMNNARQRSRDNWNSAYTAAAVNTYIRAGFV